MRSIPVPMIVDGIRIAAEAYIPRTSNSPALCLCHGIPPGPREPGDRGYSDLAEACCKAGFATLIFNFRGAGESAGSLDMPGWARDLSAALDKVLSLPRVDTSKVNLMGFSAGAAISIYVAANDPRVTAVASCACPAEFRFLPTRDKAQQYIDHLKKINLIQSPDFPPSVEDWVEGFRRVSPIKWVDNISPRPLLLVHGDQDDLVPVAHARELYERAGQPKELVIIPGAGHRLRRDPRAVEIAVEWLRKKNGLT